jgi:type I restriction enzyme S subunit
MSTLGDFTVPKIDQSGPHKTGEFTYIDISSIDNKLKRIVEPKRLPANAAPSRAKQRLQPGDVLVSMTRPNLNAVAIVSPDLEGAVGSTGFHVLRAVDSIESRWLLYAVQTNDFVEAMSSLVQGALYPAVRPKDIRAFGIEAPPLDEQRLIVAEIEKQFSRLDEAIVTLKRVKANLKHYKAVVLKAAVEGKLTVDWRNHHSDVEPASKLLERILVERRAKWRGKGKYKETAEPDISNLLPLPENWTWASLEQLSWESSYGTSVKCSYNNSGPAVLRIPNVALGKLDLRDLKFAPDSYEVEPGDQLSVGDLLIIRTNGSRNLIGRSAVIRQPLPSVSAFASYLIRFRLTQQLEIIKWLGAIWDAEFFRVWIEQRASTSAGQHNISMSVLAKLPVPMPPLTEQDQIITEVERRLSVIAELETAVRSNLTRSDRLRQSILSKAFGAHLSSENSWPLALDKEISMKIKSLPTLPAQRESSAEDNRLDLTEVLSRYPKGLPVETLFVEAGYQGDQIDQFYRDLSVLASRIEQEIPSAEETVWPHAGLVKVRLKS